MATTQDKITGSTIEYVESQDPEKKPIKGVDDALQFAAEHGSDEWSEEEERKVLRKIDYRLIPLMFLSGIVTYFDSQAYGVAAIFGMIQDLKLYSIISLDPPVESLTKYSWTTTAQVFGGLASQYILLLCAQHLPIGKFSAGIIFYSGLLALLTITLHDFAGTFVLRFFYGFQGVGIPLSLVISAMWWTREEQPLRIGIWMSGSALGGIVGQAFDYAAASIKGPYEQSPWKWIYILFGSMSILYSILYVIFFPDSPIKARFLSDRERIIAVRRLEKNHTGIQTRKLKLPQVWKAVKDPQAYIIAMVLFAFGFSTAAIGSFGALLVTSFGYSNFKSIQLLMPTSGISIVVMVISGILSSKFPGSRIFIAMSFMVPAIIGNALLWKMPRENKSALLAGLYISVSFYGAVIQIFGLITSNVAGNTKKNTLNALAFAIASAASLSSPFAFKGSEAAQGFPTGIICMLSITATAEVALVFLYIHYKRFNYRRDKAVARGESVLPATAEDVPDSELAFLDLTEDENPKFRYTC